MLRILGACAAALVIVAGLGAATPAATAVAPAPAVARLVAPAAAVTPHGGTYQGTAQGPTSRPFVVSFTYAPHVGQVMHLKLASDVGGVIEHADVAHGRVARTCSPDDVHGSGGSQPICFTLEWASDTEVTGHWGYHTGFRARTPWRFTATLGTPAHPRHGVYNGSAAYGGEYLVDRIAFHYDTGNRTVTGFGWRYPSGRGEFPDDMSVTGPHHHFSACSAALCVQGHWQTNLLVVGSWRHNDDSPHTRWRAWEARVDPPSGPGE